MQFSLWNSLLRVLNSNRTFTTSAQIWSSVRVEQDLLRTQISLVLSHSPRIQVAARPTRRAISLIRLGSIICHICQCFFLSLWVPQVREPLIDQWHKIFRQWVSEQERGEGAIRMGKVSLRKENLTALRRSSLTKCSELKSNNCQRLPPHYHPKQKSFSLKFRSLFLNKSEHSSKEEKGLKFNAKVTKIGHSIGETLVCLSNIKNRNWQWLTIADTIAPLSGFISNTIGQRRCFCFAFISLFHYRWSFMKGSSTVTGWVRMLWACFECLH